MRKQRSTGDLDKRMTSGGSVRSTASSASWMSNESSQSGPNGGSFHTDSNASFVVEVGVKYLGSLIETFDRNRLD